MIETIFPECTGCGYCCHKAPCSTAQELYNWQLNSCPELLWSEEKQRYLCGLMMRPGKAGEIFREKLCAGEGCCSNLNSWHYDVKKREQIKAKETT